MSCELQSHPQEMPLQMWTFFSKSEAGTSAVWPVRRCFVYVYSVISSGKYTLACFKRVRETKGSVEGSWKGHVHKYIADGLWVIAYSVQPFNTHNSYCKYVNGEISHVRLAGIQQKTFPTDIRISTTGCLWIVTKPQSSQLPVHLTKNHIGIQWISAVVALLLDR